MKLPLGLNLPLTQTKWASILNPLLGNISLQSVIVNRISVTGTSPVVIQHGLGRTPVGWRIIDIDTAGRFPYRSAAFNPLTLTLTFPGACNCSIEVF